MTLEKQIIDIPINGGVDTKTDARLIKPPYLSRLYNGVFDKTGRVAKRYGQESVGSTGMSGDGDPHTVFSHGKILCEVLHNDFGSGIYYYTARNPPSGSWATPLSVGSTSYNPEPFRPCEVREQPWYAGDGSVYSVDVAIYGQLLVYGWYVSGDGVYCAIVEADSGAYVFGPSRLQTITTDTRVRCAAIGANLFVFWGDTTNDRLYRAYADTTSTILGFSTPAYDALTDLNEFEIAEDSTNTRGHVLLSNSTGDCFLWRYTSTGTRDLTYSGTGVDGRGVVEVYYHAAQDLVCIYTAASAAVGALRVLSPTAYTVSYGPHTVFSNLVGSTQLRVAMARYDSVGSSTDLFIAITEYDSTDLKYSTRWNVVNNITTGTTLVSTSSTLSRGRVAIYGRAFNPYTYGPPMLPVVYRRWNASQSYYAAFLVHPQDPNNDYPMLCVSARMGHDRAVMGTFSRVVQVNSTTNTWRYLGKVQRLTDIYGADVYDMTLPGEAVRAVNVNGNTYLASGNPSCFDGVNNTEITPHWGPERPVVSLAGSGGSITAGSHQWIVMYEWEDNNGILHRSAPSPASTAATAATNDSATISLVRLSMGARDGYSQRGIKVSLYRNTAAGTIFYRVKTVTPTVSGSDATVWTVTDTSSDSTIADNEVLYTTGGVLAAEPVPPALDFLLAKNRLFMISAQSRREIWYSKQIDPTIAPEFNGALVIRCPQEATALSAMDDKVIVFSETDIYAISGDGPLDTGEQNTFTEPQLVSSDAGCISRNSIVSGPFGVMFQSEKGIYQLDRGLNVKYLGAPVEDLLSSYVINSAVLVESANEVRFTLDIESPPEGTYVSSLVYNYLYNTWSAFTNTLSTHATLWDGTYARVGTTAAVHKEDVGEYADSGSAHIPLTIRTGWINLSGLQGFQRVRKLLVLGSKAAEHTLTVKIGYDYKESFDTTITFTEAEIDALATSVYQYAIRIPRQKCQAIRFEISDGAPAGGADAGFTLSGLSLELGVKRGAMKLPSAAKK